MIPSPDRVASRFKPRLVGCDRALQSVLHDAVGANPRPLQDSDFVDAVHPPYVSLFRADR